MCYFSVENASKCKYYHSNKELFSIIFPILATERKAPTDKSLLILFLCHNILFKGKYFTFDEKIFVVD